MLQKNILDVDLTVNRVVYLIKLFCKYLTVPFTSVWTGHLLNNRKLNCTGFVTFRGRVYNKYFGIVEVMV